MNILRKLWLVRRLRKQFYEWDTATLRKHQADRIAAVLTSAKRNSPYYHQILSENDDLTLTAVPKMGKAEMMRCFDEINTAGLRRDDLIQFKIRQERAGTVDLYPGAFSVGLSSGTSGNRCLAVLSKQERQRYGCLLWARNGIPSRIKTHRILFALRTNNPAFVESGAFGAKLVHVDYTHPPGELIRLINEKNLNIVAGPPSLLAMIAQQHKSIRHPIDALISYAEVLDDEARAHLEGIFDAPVVQIYQGAEGFIGSTCKNGNLHLNEDILLVEQQDAGDTTGKATKVILTDLYRTTQPIIRYSLDDVLEIGSEPCSCGSCFRVIERIHGRADDIFHLEGAGGDIRYLFPDYVRRSINQTSDAIVEYQAIQHSIGSIEIRLTLEPKADDAAIEAAIHENLSWWAEKVGGNLGQVSFNRQLPERNPRSQKLIRVTRRF